MTFDVSDLLNSAPLLLLTLAGLVLMLLDAFSRSKLVGAPYQKSMPAETSEAYSVALAGSRGYLMPVTVLALLGVLATIAWLPGQIQGDHGVYLYREMLVLDRFGLLVSAICVIGALLGVLTAPAFLRAHGLEMGEYYALVLFSLAGMVILVMASDLVSIFLGVETMSLGVYVLAGMWRKSQRSAEAAMKYFLVGAFVSGLLIYGIALIYGSVGTTVLSEIRSRAPSFANRPLFYIGWMLVLVTFLFKVAAVPFHMWAPDTYDGAPTPVSGFMMTGVKAAGFAGMVRLFAITLGDPANSLQAYTGWVHAAYGIAILTMTLGNLAALHQESIKRMLAYSSIAHAGYLLIGLIAMPVVGDAARGPFLFYIAAYTITVVGAMGVVGWLSRDRRGGERLTLDDWAGMGQRHPAGALAMTIFLLSLGGFPPTAGFFGKFYLFRVALEKPSLLPLVLVGIANSLISVYYYLRVITTMYFRSPAPSSEPASDPLTSNSLAVGVLLCALLVLGLGIMPEWLANLCAAAR